MCNHLLKLVVLEDDPTDDFSLITTLLLNDSGYAMPPIGRVLHPRSLESVFIDGFQQIKDSQRIIPYGGR